MATFAKSSYNSGSYAASRPTYPRLLFDVVLQFHKEGSANDNVDRWQRAVDLGCGTGQATVQLVANDEHAGFQTVIALDPSPNMVKVAQESLPHELKTRIDFRQGFAEDLSFIEAGTVDVITAAQSAHWFDWSRAWPEFHRILKPGGTFAFWGYSHFRLPQYPELTPLISAYSQGTDLATSLGPHWEPGRKIVDNHFLDIDAPAASGWAALTRVFYTGSHYPALPTPREVIVKKTMSWDDFEGYLRTYSSLHRYHEAFPEDRQRPDGDIATRFRRSLMEGAGVAEGGESVVEVEWPLALVMVRRV